ncbi:MAG: efflux RND transporter permease subunit [Bryobacteraceae bacterium]
MWIVRLALRRPYTFVVMSILIAVLGGISMVQMQKDIFPYIDIPVVSVVWSYGGMAPDDMANRVVTVCERAMTTTVNDIEHIESTSYNGISVIRLYFQPNAKVEMAIAQVTSIVQTILRIMPPGIYPPSVIKYDASSVPILQLSIDSKSLSEQELYDYAQNFIRTRLATVQGAAVALPYGGKMRNVMVDIDPVQMYARQLSATDVSNALNLQNLILPAGTAKMGDREYQVLLNSSPTLVAQMNDLPIKTVNGATVFMRDVAQVRDGFTVQTNIVRVNGSRASLLTILKNGQASTLDVVQDVKEELPQILKGLPSTLNVKPLFDQSLFVRAAIGGVLREALIAAGLTGLMILLFLGSWRSTLIVCTSIPLSILTSLVVLHFLGHTINVMTLGGMALAVGILVDDATVEIENIHRNLAMKKPITRGILDGAQQIAVPAFVSTLAICIVFVPVLLLTGAARFLFTPLAMAVAFAMLASYLLSRTLIPTMVHYMLPPEVEMYQQGEEAHTGTGPIWRAHHVFNDVFAATRTRYQRALNWTLDHRAPVALVFGVFLLGSLWLVRVVGTDFFPYVDSGQMRLHVVAPEGTRIEETERVFARVEAAIRDEVGAENIDVLVDNIGLPNSGLNLALGDIATIGPEDGEILISLKEPGHTIEYQRRLRAALRRQFPDETFFFQAANMTSQILNFGLPAPIDVQIMGRNAAANYKIAQELRTRMAGIPGAVDVHVRQQVNAPTLKVLVDRTMAGQAGLTQLNVANSMLISLSSSGQVAPNQWLSPVNGVNYQVNVQTPQYLNNSIDALRRTPITAPGASTQLLDNLIKVQRTTSTEIVNHYDVQPVFDVFADVDQRDLGGVSGDVQKAIEAVRPHLAKDAIVNVRGQVKTMHDSFTRLGFGIVFAMLLVYLLMAVNFQSWVDPFIIMMATPGAFGGILWMLFATQTTLNVPSLMGTIMAIGVATANSILLVTFANDERTDHGRNAHDAALAAGFTRLRPVIMTAAAMIIGMLPMAFGMGEGGEQNAPLARAVIGGLLVATFTTLFMVPIAYTWLRGKPPVDYDKRVDEEWHEGDQPLQA